MRSVFSAGLLDGFLQHHFNPFDFHIGVSGGAANLLFFLAGLEGKSYQLYQQVIRSGQFIKPSRFIRGGHLLDMDWLFNNLVDELPDLSARNQRLASLLVGLTDVRLGRAVYHDNSLGDGPGQLLYALKASMSLPVLYRDFPGYNGRTMTDGGIADGIPVSEAMRSGAMKIMVIRSRHRDYVKVDTLWHRYLRWKLRKHRKLVRVMQERIAIHERSKQLLMHPPGKIKIIDICPPADMCIGRFSKNPERLRSAYQLGWEMSQQAIRKWLREEQ